MKRKQKASEKAEWIRVFGALKQSVGQQCPSTPLKLLCSCLEFEHFFVLSSDDKLSEKCVCYSTKFKVFINIIFKACKLKGNIAVVDIIFVGSASTTCGSISTGTKRKLETTFSLHIIIHIHFIQ